MNRRKIYMVLALALYFLLVAGCTDKSADNPARPGTVEQGLKFTTTDKYFEILVSTSLDHGQKAFQVYTPPGYNHEGSGRPYPVLYLLSPFQEDDRYYFNHGLAEVADRLIADGTIKPMIIVTIDGSSLLGGSFYTNSLRQGGFFNYMFYDTLVGEPLWSGWSESIKSKVEFFFRTLPDEGRNCRGISGVGMGGYGAFKSAIQTDFFGAVSAINAPLDFDGSGGGGFLSLFNQVFPSGASWLYADTTFMTDTTFAIDPSDSVISIDTTTTVLAVDTLGFGIDTIDYIPSTGNYMRSSKEEWLVLSASAAFSPDHETIDPDDYDLFYDESSGFPVLSLTYDTAAIVTRMQTISLDSTSYLPNHFIHLPFDSSSGSTLNDDVWALWMANNIDSLYLNGDPGFVAAFDNMNKLLITSDEAEYYYSEQINAFSEFLSAQSIGYTLQQFSGSDDLPGTSSHYLYDLLKDILIFHDNSFVLPEGLE